MGYEVHATGDTVRATVPQLELDAAIDAIRRAHGRLLSVTPVRASLEDFFLEKLADNSPAEVAR
jgi:hypothetical protein